MVVINNIDEKYFELDGVQFAKIYQPLKHGASSIGIYSIYDTKQKLQNSTLFSEFTIDGLTYGTVEETIEAILLVTYQTVSASDVLSNKNRIDNLEENQITGVVVYETFAELPATGTLLVSYKVSNDGTASNNGYWHWNGSTYVKDLTDAVLLTNNVWTGANEFSSTTLFSSGATFDSTAQFNGASTFDGDINSNGFAFFNYYANFYSDVLFQNGEIALDGTATLEASSGTEININSGAALNAKSGSLVTFSSGSIFQNLNAGEFDDKVRKSRAEIIADTALRARYLKGQEIVEPDGTHFEVLQDIPTDLSHFKYSDQRARDHAEEFRKIEPNSSDSGLYVVNVDGKLMGAINAFGIELSNQISKFRNRFIIGNRDGKAMFEATPNGIITSEQLPLFQDELVVGNKDGKVVLRIKGDKVEYVGQNSGSVVAENPFTGKILGTVGDSLSAANKYQPYLADALGMTFDASLNITGSGGFAIPSVGGTRVVPTGSGEIYWRIQDAHQYDFDVLILYMGQNDTLMTLGSITDSPFVSNVYFETATSDLATAISEIPTIDRGLNHYLYYNSGLNSARFTGTSFDDSTFLNIANWTSTRPTFAASYMGAIEILIRNLISKPSGNKTPDIYLTTLMRYWIPKIYRSDGMIDIDAMEASEREPQRLEISQLIRDIGKKYGIPVIELWDETGVTYDNADQFYPSVGNVHPADFGYERVGQTMYKQII